MAAMSLPPVRREQKPTSQQEIRQAVAFGKQAAIREVVDALYAERDRRGAFGMYAHSEATRDGITVAIDHIKTTRIDPREDPS